MCRLHFALANFKGILVGGLTVIYYGYNKEMNMNWCVFIMLWIRAWNKLKCRRKLQKTYCCGSLQLPLLLSIYSSHPSFSGKTPCFLDCWLWGWGICPRDPTMQKKTNMRFVIFFEYHNDTHQNFVTNFSKLLLHAFSIFSGKLLLSGRRLSLLFNGGNHAPRGSTGTNDIFVGNR